MKNKYKLRERSKIDLENWNKRFDLIFLFCVSPFVWKEEKRSSRERADAGVRCGYLEMIATQMARCPAIHLSLRQWVVFGWSSSFFFFPVCSYFYFCYAHRDATHTQERNKTIRMDKLPTAIAKWRRRCISEQGKFDRNNQLLLFCISHPTPLLLYNLSIRHLVNIIPTPHPADIYIGIYNSRHPSLGQRFGWRETRKKISSLRKFFKKKKKKIKSSRRPIYIFFFLQQKIGISLPRTFLLFQSRTPTQWLLEKSSSSNLLLFPPPLSKKKREEEEEYVLMRWNQSIGDIR